MLPAAQPTAAEIGEGSAAVVAAPLVDIAPDLGELCVRASFRLDEAEERLRWARAAQDDTGKVHLQAAELVRAKAFAGYEHVDDPQALLRAVAS